MKSLTLNLLCLCIFIIFAEMAVAGERYEGRNVPSLEVIQANVGMYKTGIEVIGIHKESDGAYLVITNKDSNQWGGPYKLLKLESNKWVMSQPGTLFAKFVFILNKAFLEKKQNYDTAAEAALRNAATAQEAYYVDHQTYANSIAKLYGNAYGLYFSEGISIIVDYADKQKYSMRSFHKKGNKIFFISGPGGAIRSRER